MVLKIVRIAVLAATIPCSSYAATIDFNFEFTNVSGLSLVNGETTVTGTVFGLENNSSDTAARGISLQAGGAGYGFSSSELTINSFSVINGQVVSAMAENGTVGFLTFNRGYLSLGTKLDGSFRGFIQDQVEPISLAGGGINFTPTTAVPLPSSGILLLSILAGVTGLMRRKRG